MAATETVIANLALLRMGQSTIDSIDGTDTLSVKVNTLYDQTRDELLTAGPELGWKFARRRYNGIDRDSTSITAFADYSGTVSGTTSVTSASHGLVTGDMVTIDGTTNYDDDYDIVVIDDDTFYIEEDFVADDATGTAYWTSDEYSYRYAIPSSPTVLRIVTANVGGVELTDWIQEGDYVLTNQESSEIDLLVVQQITTTTKFPPMFTRTLVLMLAIQLHYNLTQDLRAIQLLEVDLDKTMPKAIAMDERSKYVQESSQSWQEVGNTMEIE